MIFPKETVLPDDYPVFWDYWYVCDGEPRRSDIEGTVADLKRDTGATEIRRCEIMARMKASTPRHGLAPQSAPGTPATSPGPGE
jgi:hypothetical protein